MQTTIKISYSPQWLMKLFFVLVFMLVTVLLSAQTYISTEAELRAIDSNPTGSYILSNDISLATDWEPLAVSVSFKGTLDGNNHVIRNLKIKKDVANKIGFFSQIDGATIKNLGFENASVEAGTPSAYGSSVAVLAGEARSSNISNCCISGSSVSGRENVGSFVGSIVYISGAATVIENCYSTSTIKATNLYAGGIVGRMMQTTIRKCYFSGILENSGYYSGGIAGYANGGTNLIARCVVLSSYIKGGLVNRILGKKGNVTTLQLNYARTDLKMGSGDYSTLTSLPLTSCLITGLNGANIPLSTQTYSTSFPGFTDADANTSMTAFNTYFYRAANKIYNKTSSRYTAISVAAIWVHAIYWDMIMNAWKRTSDTKYLQQIEDIYQGAYVEYDKYNWNNNVKWFIYDDIMWWVIAKARAYELLHNTKYLTLAESGFNRVWNGSTVVGDAGSYADPAKGLGGGMYWCWDQANPAKPFTADGGKMSCINYPTVIGAMTLYNATKNVDYLNKAKEIYDWAHDNLFDSELGRVADSRHGSGVDWTLHIYNQATCIGAAVMLYKETGNDKYLNDAILTADYTKNVMSKDGLLPFETGIEQGIYHAIFAQYIIRLIEDGNQKQYLPWLKYNIDMGWGNRSSAGITYKDYSKACPTGIIESYDASGIPALMQVVPPTLKSDEAVNAKSRFFYEKMLGWDFTNTWKMPESDFPIFNFMTNTGFTSPSVNNQNLYAFSNNESIVCKVNQRATIWIYQLNGVLTEQMNLNDNSEKSVKLPIGVYLLKSLSDKKVETIKMINL